MPDEQNNIPSFEGPSIVRPSNATLGEQEQKDTLPGEKNTDVDQPAPTASTAPDRVGPGTGDGLDSRPLGDPDAPQGTSREEVPGGNIPAAVADRPAPAGEVRTSWAEQGHTNS